MTGLGEQLVLRPYKSLGVFCDGNQQCLYNAGKKLYLASTCGHSFKTYSLPDLRVGLLGPHFDGKLRAIAAFNEFIFIAVKNSVLKLRHYHVLGEMKMDDKISCMLLMGDQLAVADINGQLRIFDHHSKQCVAETQLDFSPSSLIHPPTYLNKILIAGDDNLELWNVSSMKRIYAYTSLLESKGKGTTTVASQADEDADKTSNVVLTAVEASPVLDIVAFAFSNGRIVLHDIKKDKSVLVFRTNSRPISMGFSKVERPLLAIGDENGSIVIWDLNEKKIFSQLKGVFSGAVTSIIFMPHEQVFIAASGRDNAVLQYRFEEYEESKFAVLRKRQGATNALLKVRFANDLHIFASSTSEQADIRDVSLINECMSAAFSAKQQSKEKLKRKHIYTEQNAGSQVNQILDFSFSMNRASDWANLLTCHKESDKPCIWSSEDHSIVKKDLQLFNKDQKEQNRQITSVFVTKCGNFGVLGFDDGSIIKVNMQSGAFQKSFSGHHSSSITSIFVNSYNKYLISADAEGKMVIWDFYSGQHLQEQTFGEEKIVLITGSNYSHHFLIGLTDHSLEMWDMLSLRRGRRFTGHTQKILDACFAQNNKHVFSTSQDSTLKIFDVASNEMIANFSLPKPIISIDVSPNGEFLISVFANSREINVWHNLVDILPWASSLEKQVRFVSPLKWTHVSDRRRYYLKDTLKQEEEELEEQMLLEGKKDYGLEAICDNSNIIRFTALQEGKWLQLIHLDEIRERNKLENTEEIEFKMPFFLDFSKKDDVREELKKEYQSKLGEQSRIIKENKNKYLAELGTPIQKLLLNYEETSAQQLLEELKKLTASQADYELRTALFGNSDNSITKLLTLFSAMFDSSDELDLKNAYFSRVIKISGDELIRDPQYKSLLVAIRDKIKVSWQRLLDRQHIIASMAEHFAKIPN